VVKVDFTEGQDVKAGQLLFTIDPRPFEAVLAQAHANVGRDTAQMRQAEAAHAQRQAEVQQVIANLERDQAQLENARVQEKRYKTLVDKELVAREQYDQFRTNLSASRPPCRRTAPRSRTRAPPRTPRRPPSRTPARPSP